MACGHHATEKCDLDEIWKVRDTVRLRQNHQWRERNRNLRPRINLLSTHWQWLLQLPPWSPRTSSRCRRRSNHVSSPYGAEVAAWPHCCHSAWSSGPPDVPGRSCFHPPCDTAPCPEHRSSFVFMCCAFCVVLVVTKFTNLKTWWHPH